MWVGVPGEGSRSSVQCVLLPQVSARPRAGHVACPPVALKVVLRVLSGVTAICALGERSGQKAEFEFPEELPSCPWAELGRSWGLCLTKQAGRGCASSLSMHGRVPPNSVARKNDISPFLWPGGLSRALAGLQWRSRLGPGPLRRPAWGRVHGRPHSHGCWRSWPSVPRR